jgi:hypothetical protein
VANLDLFDERLGEFVVFVEGHEVPVLLEERLAVLLELTRIALADGLHGKDVKQTAMHAFTRNGVEWEEGAVVPCSRNAGGSPT